MNDHFLDNAKVTANYSGGVFTVTANQTGFNDFLKACNDSANGAPEGENFIIKARYADPNYGTVGGEPPFETLRASYTLNGNVELTRVATLDSNNGANLAWAFDSGVDLILHGTVTSDLLNEVSARTSDSRTISDTQDSVETDYTITSTAIGSPDTASDWVVISKDDDANAIRITPYVQISNVVGGGSVRLSCQYMDAGGTPQQVGRYTLHQSGGVDTRMLRLDDTQVNAAGNWQVRAVGFLSGGATSSLIFAMDVDAVQVAT